MITTLLVWACVILINAIVLGLVPEKRSPSSAMAWLLLILLVPVFGLLVYLLIGSPYVPRKRREEQRAVGAVIQSSLATDARATGFTGPARLARLGHGSQPTAGLASGRAEQFGHAVPRL